MPWGDSDRRSRLPANWPELRAEAKRLNPEQRCHRCGLPGGTDLDHKKPGDWHAQENLDWIHSHRDVKAGRSDRNCHAEKTRNDRPSVWAPKERHPAL
jgi:hypothetical protein